MATKTEHLGLHQWEAGDSFLRSDFNADFAKIDAAVGSAQTLLAGYNAAGTITAMPTAAGMAVDVGFTPKLVILFSPNKYAIFFITPVGAVYQACKDQTSAGSYFNYFNFMSLTENGFRVEKNAYYFSASTEKPSYYIAFR